MDLKKISYNELCSLNDIIEAEMMIRQTEKPVGYVCCECSFTDKDPYVVHDHLTDVHGYPNEDACIGIKNILR